jgi:hypothetical protein
MFRVHVLKRRTKRAAVITTTSSLSRGDGSMFNLSD